MAGFFILKHSDDLLNPCVCLNLRYSIGMKVQLILPMACSLLLSSGVVIAGEGTICNDLLITDDDVLDIHVDDGLACLAMGGHGLQLVDVSDPGQPVLLDRLETTNGTIALDRAGDVVYLADGHNGFKCVDVSDPTDVAVLGVLDFPNFVDGVVVRDGLAYLTDGFIDGGLRIVDVSDPADPTLVGTLVTDGMAVSMLLDGPHLYLMDGSRGFKVIDVSDPTDPVVVGSRPNRGGAWTTTIALDGDYAFVVEHNWIVTYNISDPTNPIELELVEHSAYLGIHDLQVHLGTLWAAQGGYPGSLTPFALFDAELIELSAFELSGEANRVVFTENAVYVAQSDFGIVDLPPDEWNGVPGLNIITDFGGCSACPADLTLDGVLDFFDISEFLTAFARSRIEADFTQDGVIDFFDISAFLQAFGAGCP